MGPQALSALESLPCLPVVRGRLSSGLPGLGALLGLSRLGFQQTLDSLQIRGPKPLQFTRELFPSLGQFPARGPRYSNSQDGASKFGAVQILNVKGAPRNLLLHLQLEYLLL